MNQVWIILANNQQEGIEYITCITRGYQMNSEVFKYGQRQMEIFYVILKQFELIKKIYYIPLIDQAYTIEELYHMFIKYQINTIEGIISGNNFEQNIPSAIKEIANVSQIKIIGQQIIILKHDLTTQLQAFRDIYLYICISKSNQMNYYFLKELTQMSCIQQETSNQMARLFYWKCEENEEIKHNYYIDLEVSENFDQSQFQEYLHQVTKQLQKNTINGFLFLESLNQPTVTVIETIGQFCNWQYELNVAFYDSSLIIPMNSILSKEKTIKKLAFIVEYVKKQMPRMKIAQQTIDICKQAIADLVPYNKK